MWHALCHDTMCCWYNLGLHPYRSIQRIQCSISDLRRMIAFCSDHNGCRLNVLCIRNGRLDVDEVYRVNHNVQLVADQRRMSHRLSMDFQQILRNISHNGVRCSLGYNRTRHHHPVPSGMFERRN